MTDKVEKAIECDHEDAAKRTAELRHANVDDIKRQMRVVTKAAEAAVDGAVRWGMIAKSIAPSTMLHAMAQIVMAYLFSASKTGTIRYLRGMADNMEADMRGDKDGIKRSLEELHQVALLIEAEVQAGQKVKN